jgi:hypothetical protein
MLLVCRQFSAQGPTKDRRSSRYLLGKNREQATCSREECHPSRCNGCSFRFHCLGTTIRAIFTTVLAQYILGWWGNFTDTWRWFRMRTRGSFFRLMFRASDWSSGDQWSYRCSSPTHFSQSILRGHGAPYIGATQRVLSCPSTGQWARTCLYQDQCLSSPAPIACKNCATQSMAHIS